ncbi:MAG: ABC transporter permease, partial [Planctomycetota bacterium]|nr:ABC transporter permease [Planctomycetota bacterium]
MWAYVFRRLIYNIPVYLTIIFVVMALLRVNDPVYAFLGKNTTQEDIDRRREEFGLDRPFLTQYGEFLKRLAFFDFSQESWSR